MLNLLPQCHNIFWLLPYHFLLSSFEVASFWYKIYFPSLTLDLLVLQWVSLFTIVDIPLPFCACCFPSAFIPALIVLSWNSAWDSCCCATFALSFCGKPSWIFANSPYLHFLKQEAIPSLLQFPFPSQAFTWKYYSESNNSPYCFQWTFFISFLSDFWHNLLLVDNFLEFFPLGFRYNTFSSVFSAIK